MDMEQYVSVTAALANENRLGIVERLAAQGELCAQDLLAHFNISQPTMSQHIKVLKDSGLIVGRKDGRWQYFHVDTVLFEEFLEYGRVHILNGPAHASAHRKSTHHGGHHRH